MKKVKVKMMGTAKYKPYSVNWTGSNTMGVMRGTATGERNKKGDYV